MDVNLLSITTPLLDMTISCSPIHQPEFNRWKAYATVAMMRLGVLRSAKDTGEKDASDWSRATGTRLASGLSTCVLTVKSYKDRNFVLEMVIAYGIASAAATRGPSVVWWLPRSSNPLSFVNIYVENEPSSKPNSIWVTPSKLSTAMAVAAREVSKGNRALSVLVPARVVHARSPDSRSKVNTTPLRTLAMTGGVGGLATSTSWTFAAPAAQLVLILN